MASERLTPPTPPPPNICDPRLGYVEEDSHREQQANSDRVSLAGGRVTFDTSCGDRSPTLLSCCEDK
ncbi:hypothetical protein E2C01_030361 [Portunus trituberculatus]|uniref:Uncharacterized protein n=1 Tax=Portunus trituberculatus TaxID=210409 RepID=A0A5B7EVI2_PORTR|nr:hypothetical protein [Portunus trituberculatus]